MNDILRTILSRKRKDLRLLKGQYGDIDLSKRTKEIIPFESIFSKGRKIKIIAEIKPASPSEGILIQEEKIPEIAAIYNNSKVSAISVLTDEYFFYGKYENLKIVSSVTNKPILCKDFIINKYQIDLAYINNADAILLIVEALPEQKLIELYEYASNLKLGVLLEFHYRESLDIIHRNNFRLIGINNRNLRTMRVSLTNSVKLKKLIKKKVPIISESGINKPKDLLKLEKAGFSGALIGTSILKSKNIKEKLEKLLNYKNKRSLL